jgi:hypothetical protein
LILRTRKVRNKDIKYIDTRRGSNNHCKKLDILKHKEKEHKGKRERKKKRLIMRRIPSINPLQANDGFSKNFAETLPDKSVSPVSM